MEKPENVNNHGPTASQAVEIRRTHAMKNFREVIYTCEYVYIFIFYTSIHIYIYICVCIYVCIVAGCCILAYSYNEKLPRGDVYMYIHFSVLYIKMQYK